MAVSTFVTVRSNFTPTVTFDPLKKDSNPIRGGLLKIIQPSVDVNVPVLGNVHYAPYGEPTGFGLAIMSLIGILAVYGAYRLLK